MKTETQYDSAPETTEHIKRVRDLLHACRFNLLRRGAAHDLSKLKSPEKEMFDRATGKLNGLTYGSEEYRESLKELGPALKHHYANNSHHPEHYPNGVDGMSLLDVIEMLCDWKAATERHADGDILRSMEINKTRFALSDQMHSVMLNTIRELGWFNTEVGHAGPDATK